MNALRRAILAVAIFFAACAPVAAQWQVPTNAIPYGKGAGVTGFGFVGPCASGSPIVGQGPGAPPSCGGHLSSVVRVVTASGPITVTTADSVIVVNKTIGAPTAVSLPTSPSTGDTYTIKDGKGDASTNNITVTPAAGTIDGLTSYVINVAKGSVTFLYNGTQWNII